MPIWREQPSESAAAAFAALRTLMPSPRAPFLAAQDPELAPLLLLGGIAPAIRLAATVRWDHLLNTVSVPLDSLRSRGIPVWAWKGFDYARSLYPAPWLRSMQDIDLLIRPGDLDSAVNNFVAHGWEEVSVARPLLTSGIVGSTLLTRGIVSVDLHTSPLHFPSMLPGRLPGDLLRNRREISPGVYGLSPEHSLLLCLVHMLFHRPPRQISWVDSALLVEEMRGRDAWMAFAWSAVRTGLGPGLGKVLEALRRGMKAPVPEAVTDSLAGSAGRGLLFDLAGWRKGMPTVAAALCARGWRKTSFVAALLYRAAMGIPAADRAESAS